MADKDSTSLVISIASLIVSGTGWFVTYYLGRRSARHARDKQRADEAENLVWQIADLATDIYVLPGDDPVGRSHQRKIIGQHDKLFSKLRLFIRGRSDAAALDPVLMEFWEFCTGMDSTDFSRAAMKVSDKRINDMRSCAASLCQEIQKLAGE